MEATIGKAIHVPERQGKGALPIPRDPGIAEGPSIRSRDDPM